VELGYRCSHFVLCFIFVLCYSFEKIEVFLGSHLFQNRIESHVLETVSPSSETVASDTNLLLRIHVDLMEPSIPWPGTSRRGSRGQS
jgi:hypothetical protein